MSKWFPASQGIIVIKSNAGEKDAIVWGGGGEEGKLLFHPLNIKVSNISIWNVSLCQIVIDSLKGLPQQFGLFCTIHETTLSPHCICGINSTAVCLPFPRILSGLWIVCAARVSVLVFFLHCGWKVPFLCCLQFFPSSSSSSSSLVFVFRDHVMRFCSLPPPPPSCPVQLWKVLPSYFFQPSFNNVHVLCGYLSNLHAT